MPGNKGSVLSAQGELILDWLRQKGAKLSRQRATELHEFQPDTHGCSVQRYNSMAVSQWAAFLGTSVLRPGGLEYSWLPERTGWGEGSCPFSQFSHSVVSDSLSPHGLQHARPPCPSPTPGIDSNSCPLSQWCHPTISSSVVPFSSHLQSFPASGSFQMSQFFTSGGQSTGLSASALVPPLNI